MIHVSKSLHRFIRKLFASGILVGLLYLVSLRRVRAEDRLDFKTLYYQEDGGRMSVFAPSVFVEKDLSATTTIHVEGIYNVISGMSPTGAPPVPQIVTTRVPTATSFTSSSQPSAQSVITTPRYEDDDEDGHDENDGLIRRKKVFYSGVAGATPAPAPAPAPTSNTASPSNASSSGGGTVSAYSESSTEVPGTIVPLTNADDTRIGLTFGLNHKRENHTYGAAFTYSEESDYTSYGLSLTDAIDFNQKNTTLSLGLGLAHDQVSGYFLPNAENKDTVDLLLGITQLINRKTVLTVNATLGQTNGYLTDPYKVVELNGALVPEQRPDSRQRQILYVALTRYLESLSAGVELSYRYYSDDFGIRSNTFSAAWYQELSEKWMLRPSVRLYEQSEADFYGIRFSGDPENYSSDYRLSALTATGVGLQLIWKPNERFSLDLSVDRYVQEGNDGVTWSDAYPSATAIMFGARLWF